MFKTLIATCLLTFSSCTGIGNNYQRKETRNNAVSFAGVYGAYVLRDDFASKLQDYYDNHDDTRYHSFTLDFTEYNKQIDALYSRNNNTDVAYLQTLTIGIQINSGTIYNADITFYAKINHADTIITEIEVPDVPFYDCDNLNEWISNGYSTYTDSIKYHTLYFNGNFNFTADEYDLFDVFYTNLGNQYNVYYNGWYHCVSAITWSNYTRFQCQLIADNLLYSYNSFDSNSWYGINYLGTEDETSFNLYSSANGWQLKDMNVYLNGMIPLNIYNLLVSKGTFAYVQPTVPSDFSFQDFFFGIADTPLYYAWSLLNWDLFGLNLFVAFCGLCTLALVVFVIKKLI